MLTAATEEQAKILASVDGFLDRHLPPMRCAGATGHIPPYDLLPAMGEAGFFALALPEDEGGLGEDWRTVALVQERLGQHAYMAASILNRVVGFGIASVRGYGSAAQTRRAAAAPGRWAAADRAGTDRAGRGHRRGGGDHARGAQGEWLARHRPQELDQRCAAAPTSCWSSRAPRRAAVARRGSRCCWCRRRRRASR